MQDVDDDAVEISRVELPESPDYEIEVLGDAAELVLRDLRETFNTDLEAEVFLDDDQSAVCRFFDRGELSMPIVVDVSDDVAATVVTLAADVQDSDVFYDHVEPWPRCTIHPEAGHSLVARRFGRDAWWSCPSGGGKVTFVGQLAG